MKRLFPLLMLSALLLASCGSGTEDTDGGSLESMFDSNGGTEDPTLTPGETPYSEGPTEIPSDLMPNE